MVAEVVDIEELKTEEVEVTVGEVEAAGSRVETGDFLFRDLLTEAEDETGRGFLLTGSLMPPNRGKVWGGFEFCQTSLAAMCTLSIFLKVIVCSIRIA